MLLIKIFIYIIPISQNLFNDNRDLSQVVNKDIHHFFETI